MQRSTDRILTTHTGSLPRPRDLLLMVRARARGEPTDEHALQARLRQAVGEIVRKQAELGIDVVDDGEFGKPSFVTYVRERLAGLTRQEGERQSPWIRSREAISFPEFYRQQAGAVNARQALMACTGPISYRGHAELKRDLGNFKAALEGVKVVEAFVPSISPSNVEDWNRNAHYKSGEEYLYAIADAMREEYQAIIDAGLSVQLDDPAFAENWDQSKKEPSVEGYRRYTQRCVEILNNAIRGLPQEKIRFHLCWGSWHGPHTTDIPMKHLVDLMLQVNAGAYSFEAANARHGHEWKLWKDITLPAGKVIMPGIVSHSTNLIEHPELVADRIVNFAEAVGRDNVVAWTDCGLGGRVHPQIAWAKLEALAQGAELATKRLWRRAAA